MEDREDIRKHELKPRTITISLSIEVVTEHEPKSFLPMLSDDLAAMLTDRIKDTPGMIHLRTAEWDVSLQ